jgi:hypothetical protein
MAKKSKNGSLWYYDPEEEDNMILPNVYKYLPLDTT